MPQVIPLSTNCTILQSAPLDAPLTIDHFMPSFWQEKGAICGESHGRNATYFIQQEAQQWVLRHYYRGGMVRHLSKDHYLYTGLHSSRVFQELNLLETLGRWELPAPTPVGGLLVRSKGFWYCADILMGKISNAEDLYQTLKARALPKMQWREIGKTIARFHEHGVYHADLNCHNIMIDDRHQIWLIDFDRATLQPRSPERTSWMAQNLGRLYRSFCKEKAKHRSFHFSDNDWEYLLSGYDTLQ